MKCQQCKNEHEKSELFDLRSYPMGLAAMCIKCSFDVVEFHGRLRGLAEAASILDDSGAQGGYKAALIRGHRMKLAESRSK